MFIANKIIMDFNYSTIPCLRCLYQDVNVVLIKARIVFTCINFQKAVAFIFPNSLQRIKDLKLQIFSFTDFLVVLCFVFFSYKCYKSFLLDVLSNSQLIFTLCCYIEHPCTKHSFVKVIRLANTFGMMTSMFYN